MITEEAVMGAFNLSSEQWEALPDLVRQCLAETFDGQQAEPEVQKPLVFGEDVYHHGDGCNGEFILRVKVSFRGTTFSADGYDYDELDPDEDESKLYCEECGYEVDFGVWQEAATEKEKS